MESFFRSIGIEMPSPELIRKKAAVKYFYKAVAVTSPQNDWLTVPNSKYTLSGHHLFGDVKGTPYKVLFKNPETDAPMMIAVDKVLGKGLILFSYCYLERPSDNPFLDNLIKKAYGKIQKLSSKALLRKKLRNESAPSLPDRKLLMLSEKAATLHLQKIGKSTRNSFKPTKVEIARRENTLHVKYICHETDPKQIVAEKTTRDSAVYQDDCVELFLRRNTMSSAPLYQIVVNSRGVIYDMKDRDSSWNSSVKVKTAVRETYWEVELEVPLQEMDITGPSFLVNFSREGNRGKALSAWIPAPQLVNPAAMGWATTLSEKEFLESQQTVNKRNTGKVVIWQKPIFTKIFDDTFPSDNEQEVKHISVLVARNEKENAAILISNMSDDNIYFRVEPEFYLDKRHRIFYDKMFSLNETVPWRSNVGTVFSEPIVKLNEGNILAVPSLETRQLWIDIKTDLPAGIYNWSLTFVPVNRNLESKKVTFSVKVLPLRFPDKMPFTVFAFGPTKNLWGYFLDDRLTENYVKFARSHYINMGFDHGGHAAKTILPGGKISENIQDYAMHEKLWQKMDMDWFYDYHFYYHFLNWLRKRTGNKWKSYDIRKSPEVRQAFRNWMINYDKYWKSIGVDYKRFLIQLRDEASGPVIDEMAEAARIIKEVNPNIRISNTIGTVAKREDIEKMNQFVDVWMPWELRLIQDKFSFGTAREEQDFYRSSGKPYIPYDCRLSCNIADYTEYFRLRGIKSFLIDADGIAFWTYAGYDDWRGKKKNDWKSSEDTNMRGVFLIHHGDNGPISTIRGEAFREAVEDFYLLKLAAKSSDPAVKALIGREYLSSLVKSKDPVKIKSWRDALLEKLGKASKRNQACLMR